MLNEQQLQLVWNLLELPPLSKCKPREGKYLVLTKTELFTMNEVEFISLCRDTIPAEEDLIVAFALKRQEVIASKSLLASQRSNYCKIAFKNTLIKAISKTYITVEISKMKENYPSFFTIV